MRREDLLLDAAHRQHQAPERRLAGHGHIAPHPDAGQERSQRREDGDARRRAVLRNRARREVDMDVLLLEETRVDAQLGRLVARVAERCLAGLLHHVAELSGERDAALALHLGALDEEQVAARCRPGEAGGHAGKLGALGRLGVELLRPEDDLQLFRRDAPLQQGALGHVDRHRAADVGDGALEVADAGLPRVAGDQLGEGGVGDLDVVDREAVLLDLFRDQVVLRDVDLFFEGVARQLDDLHTVAQGRRDGVELVGRGDEHDLREIVGHVEIVVGEGVVLFRVQHLE